MNIAAKFILDCIFDSNFSKLFYLISDRIKRHLRINPLIQQLYEIDISIYIHRISIILVSNFALYMGHDNISRNENESNKTIMSSVYSYITISN